VASLFFDCSQALRVMQVVDVTVLTVRNWCIHSFPL
jgi:hypothetical protein